MVRVKITAKRFATIVEPQVARKSTTRVYEGKMTNTTGIAKEKLDRLYKHQQDIKKKKCRGTLPHAIKILLKRRDSLVIDKETFSRVFLSIFTDITQEMDTGTTRITQIAIDIIQCNVEYMLEKMFEIANVLTTHRRRKTITVGDLEGLRQIIDYVK